MIQVITEVAKETLGEKSNVRNQDCIDIINKKNIAREKLLQRITRINHENYCELRGQAKRKRNDDKED